MQSFLYMWCASVTFPQISQSTTKHKKQQLAFYSTGRREWLARDEMAAVKSENHELTKYKLPKRL